ncbi:nucleoside-diphosphate-sugar epimerase [Rhizobium sp. BK226]|uniref:SDR family oxidoreductase n=1 Tax=Rhizobium TaxID=379 RepID=UPI001613BD54|nr:MULTISPECIES: aldehyde reductase [Rhizobium]MBB4112291.1 nucleoside-diphosphate-sugar epimerase [Rhizobium sp. BK226]UTS87577.1 aldehyde reductase [Rhizobium anhuiense bv. trifolii]
MNTATDDPTTVTVLVTGIGGFLAGHIGLQLLDQGYRVRGSLRRLDKSDAVQSQFRAQIHKDALERLSFVQADLDSDDGWTAAVEGCSYVIHRASPFPPGFPENEDALIQTARDGALRVLHAAHRARVKRVVLTSSIAATNHGDGKAPFTEKNWTDPEGQRATPYYKSKTLTERAAWIFAHEVGLDLAVINPSMILGPLLSANFGTSVGLIHHLMTGQFEGIPRFGFSVVDVRDVADAHIRAMTHPVAKSQRFIVGGRFFWLRDLVAVLAASFPEYAARLPSGEVPDEVVKAMAQSDPNARIIVHELNRDLSVSAEKAQRVLNWRSRPEEDAIRASAQSLIDLGLVRRRGEPAM